MNLRSSTPNVSPTLNAMLIGVIVIAAMYFAREVLIPIALAGILSFMLAPLVRLLQRLRLPRVLAVLIVAVLAFAAIFALARTLVAEVERLADNLPTYQETIAKKIESLRGRSGGTTGTLERARGVLIELNKQLAGAEHKPGEIVPPADVTSIESTWIPVEVHEPPGAPLETLAALINPLLGPLATTTLIVVFVIFILIQQEDLRDRLIRLAGSTDIPHTTAALDEAGRRLSRLFLTQLTINAAFGAAVGAGLALIGIPTPFVWGVLAGILRFVPFVGPILGAIFPLALALSVGSGWSMVIWTISLFVVLEGVTGQVIEPVFEGHSTGLTPIAIIIAATFWAWLWGPVGLVIATPLTVVLVVLGRHVEALKFFDVLLGDEPALTESEVFYQRMLSNDPLAVVEHAKAFMARRSLSHYCDLVARPALALAHKDVERGVLEKDKLETFRTAVEGLFADIVHEYRALRGFAPRGKETQTQNLPVLRPDELIDAWRSEAPLIAVGTHSDLDRAAASILAMVARTHGVPARVLPPSVLSAMNIENLDLSDTALICLSYFDCKTPARIQYVARRAKGKTPNAKIMLGLWTATDSVLETVRAEVGADFAVNTLHDAATIILAEASGGKSLQDETEAAGAVAEPSSVIRAPSMADPGLFGA
ncbi:MAG: AI-2E family transporter [Hyphomicrobiales bacterium]|nr:AI-2E family transporter [Hyphomicrobiales bacterium]